MTDADELRLADSAIELMKKAGISLRPDSRLPTAREDLSRATKLHVHMGPGDPETERWLAETRRTILEFSTIASTLSHMLGEIKPRLQRAVQGPTVPRSGRPDPARDVQAELLAAAALAAGGYTFSFAEPDLLAPDFAEIPVGLAVKRASSLRPDQLQKRLRKARDQLYSNNASGIALVNATTLLDEVYKSDRSADLSMYLYGRVNAWLVYIHERDQAQSIIGVIGMGSSMQRTGHEWDCRLVYIPKFLAADSDAIPRLYERFEEMADRMGRGLQQAMSRIINYSP